MYNLNYTLVCTYPCVHNVYWYKCTQIFKRTEYCQTCTCRVGKTLVCTFVQWVHRRFVDVDTLSGHSAWHVVCEINGLVPLVPAGFQNWPCGWFPERSPHARSTAFQKLFAVVPLFPKNKEKTFILFYFYTFTFKMFKLLLLFLFFFIYWFIYLLIYLFILIKLFYFTSLW